MGSRATIARLGDLILSAELEVAATPEEVWEGLTNPELTRRYYFGLAIDSDLQPGSEYAYRGADGEAAESGTLLEVEAPRRLRTTSRMLFSQEFRDDPPHRVTWEIEPIPQARSRVRLTVDGFASETATYGLHARNGGVANQLRALSTVVDRDEVARLARVERVDSIVVRELTPNLVDDFLAFFDRDAFADNPGWSSCYCMEKHVAADEWSRRTGADNRRDQEARIRGGAGRGLLAYVDGRPVGWCNAGPRTAMIGLDHLPDLRTHGTERVGAIVCFVIASRYRRHGVARQLLDSACESLAGQGFAVAEAYPSKQGGSDASEYRGPLQMYLDAGFTAFRDTPRWTVVRKALAQA
jgi:uncharacterized protein YndB with AHSA1/START domain/GNAT superfamily N-acetyltransferase